MEIGDWGLGIGIFAPVGSLAKTFAEQRNWEISMINKNNKLINRPNCIFTILNEPFLMSHLKMSFASASP